MVINNNIKNQIMKKKITFSLLFIAIISFGQSKMITKTGKITFEASVPAFEEIKAKNDNVTCVLNTTTGEIASLSLMKGFRFKIALMEEHFNENYVESDSYPKATFKGKIDNFDISKVTSTLKEYTIKGKLEMHGKSKDITIIGRIKKSANGIELISTFNINTNDFDIKIPKVVSSKVSKIVTINFNFNLI